MATFLSDNVAGAHPRITSAVLAADAGDAMPYGDDHWSERLDEAFSRLFEAEVAVIPCVTGTAANALALSLVAGPINAVCVHGGSHVYRDECNAPELYTGGARLSPVGGAEGKIALDALADAVTGKDDRHAAQPSAISIAQATEAGTVYSADEVLALSDFARRHGMKMHMDGARFSNAVAGLGVSPADITWRAGVDVLSFGATKNGCFFAEAVILFDRRLAQEARYRAKRAGQLLSKMRFLAAQLLALVEDDLWLSNARSANRSAQAIAKALASVPGAKVIAEPQANMVFARLPSDSIRRLQEARLAGYLSADGVMRLCTSWRTSEAEIRALLKLVCHEEGIATDAL